MTKPPVLGLILYLLASIIGLLPLALLRALGTWTGWLSYRLDSRETQVARRNMQIIHPDDNTQQRELKVKGILKSSGQTLFETLAVWTRPRQRVQKLVCSVYGRQHLDEALAKGKGVLIAAPHYGNWELLLKFLADNGPLSLVYRVPKKPYGDDFLKRARGGVNVTLVPAEATAMRPLLKALQRGETVGITPDQHPLLGAAGPEGFYLDCGFSGTGFKTAPAVGLCMSELILDGVSKSVDLSIYAPDRFSRGKPIKGEHNYGAVWH